MNPTVLGVMFTRSNTSTRSRYCNDERLLSDPGAVLRLKTYAAPRESRCAWAWDAG